MFIFCVGGFLVLGQSTLQDYNDVCFVLRVDSRIISAKSGFAQAYAYTGPPSGGKSYIVLRLLRFLGQGSLHHAQPLPGAYFISPPRQDGDASRPVTAALAGCRLTCPKEQPTKPLDPGALKSILDGRDVDVAARANNSKSGEKMSFSVTWAIVIQSQGAIKLREDETDVGVLDKVLELRPPFQFMSEAEMNPEDPRCRKADPALLDLCDRGGLGAELFFHAQCWYDLLSHDVCKHRTVYPPPPNSVSYRKEAESVANTNGDQIKQWMVDYLEYSTEAEASPTKVVHAAMRVVLGKVEPSMRTMAGIGPKTWQYRRGAKAGHHDYYKVIIPGKGTDAKPVRVKAH